jgi:hypothetical protein
MDDEAAMAAHVALMDRHEELHPDLKPWLVPMKSGLMLKHPLVFNAFHGDQMNAWANERYRLKLAALDQARASGDWYTYIWLHERPHRVEALQDIAFNLRGREYWEMMSHVWSDSENIWQHRRAWRQVWLSKEPERDMVMDATEREHLASLPDGLTIYRGVSLRCAMHGLSWTLDREKAQWFANRRLCFKRRRPIVLQTVARKADVMAYFAGRNEQEIVVHPNIARKLAITIL